jgi:long-chain acyl-CoA synthetase
MRTLIDLFLQIADAPPRDNLLAFRGKNGKAVSISSAEFVAGVLAVRRYLQELGLREGDRVAIWAANCPEWHIADFGCIAAGMVVVPLYATAPMSQVEFVLSHSESRAVLFAGDIQTRVLSELRNRLPALCGLMALDDRSASWHIRLRDQIASSAALPDPDALESVRSLAQSLSDDSVASIVYTSGTTGQPKGVMLTHANLCFNLRQCIQRLEFRSVERALSVLPLAHVFERLLCYGYFASGISIAYGDPHDLKELLPLHRPATMGCVPRVLEKILESVHAEIDHLPARKRRLAHWMLKSSAQRVIENGGGGISAWAGSILSKPLLYARVRRKLAGLQFLVCGGAYLDPAVEAFFRAAGFSVLQGYGLTETSPVIALNSFGPEGLGTVGPPLDGVEVRIDETGQILTRGPHVMKGYYRDLDATEESLRDGWFRTGDLGSLDSSGRLRVLGRAKDTIVLSTGKKVSSSHVEQVLSRCAVLQSVVVVGNHRKFLSALVVPRWDKVRQFAAGRNLTLDTDLSQNASPLIHPEVASWIAAEIAGSSSELAEHERIKRFCLLPEEELADPEIVTPTQKLRRSAFEARYRHWIDRMYTDPDPFLITGLVMSAAGGAELQGFEKSRK